MDGHEERLARNQTIFREVNERVAEVAGDQSGAEPIGYEFFCECSDAECLERVRLTLGEYQSVRAKPTWFVIAAGHEFREIEQVVRRNDGYEVVQKRDDAGELVAETDPRD